MAAKSALCVSPDMFQNCAESSNNVKCGEIYYEADGNKITFLCLVCDLHFGTEKNVFEHFAAHCNDSSSKYEDSFQDDMEKIVKERSTDTEDSFKDDIFFKKNLDMGELNKKQIDEFQLVSKNVSASTTAILLDDPIKVPSVRKSSKDNLFHCPFEKCEKTKETDELIRIHMRNVHVLDHQIQADGVYQCPICQSNFKRKGDVSVHVRNVHKLLSVVNIEPSKIDSKYHCPVCGLERRRLYTLNIHLRQQHEEYFSELLTEQQSKITPYRRKKKYLKKICQICGKILSNPQSLRDHIAMHKGSRLYKCNYCDKSFTSKSILRGHTAIHTIERNYKCDYCDKKFLRRTEKNQHELRVHLKEKRFECIICGHKFYTIALLKIHHRRHTGSRPYSCEICSKSFFDGTMLKDHMVIHSDAKDYECDICNAQFSRKRNLVAHKQTHSNKKKYKCEECGQEFAQCAGLYSHKKTHHK